MTQPTARAAAHVYGLLLAVGGAAVFCWRGDPATWRGLAGFAALWPVMTGFAGLAWQELVPPQEERESRWAGAGLAGGGLIVAILGAVALEMVWRSGARLPGPAAVMVVGGVVCCGRGVAVLAGFGRTVGDGVLMLMLWLVFPLIVLWV